MNSGVWNRLTRIAPAPDAEPGLIVSVDQAMQQCRVTPGGMIDESEWFADTILASQLAIEGPRGGGIGLLTSQWRLSLDRWPVDYIIVPIVPIVSIDSITYLDTAYDEHTLAVDQYVYDLDADPVHVRRAFGVVWPILGIIPGAVKVTFTVGFGDTAESVPADLKHAVKLMVSHYYNHRDAVVGVEGRDSSAPLPLGVDAILDRYRVGRLG